MTKFIIVLSALLFAVGCNNTASTTDTGGVVTGKVNERNKLREDKDPSGAVKKGSLVLRMADAKARKGETVCLPVEVAGFNNLIGLQYTMRFDSAALKYTRLRNYGLPQYGASNFGVRFVERGYLSTLWHDASLQGVTKPAGTTMFEVCFENLMAKGEETEVWFADGPTSFEVIAADMNQLHFVYANGKVTSR